MSKMKGWFFLNLSDLIYKCGKEGVYLHTYYIPINIVDTIFCLASICMQKYQFKPWKAKICVFKHGKIRDYMK